MGLEPGDWLRFSLPCLLLAFGYSAFDVGPDQAIRRWFFGPQMLVIRIRCWFPSFVWRCYLG